MRTLTWAAVAILAFSTACGPVVRGGRAPAGAGEPPVMGAPAEGPVAGDPPLVQGTRVAAKWTDGKWYFGTIAQVDGGRYAIDYADGDKGSVGPGELHPIAPPGAVRVGDHVLAVWKGATMYPGRVDAIENGKANVRWDDGDTPLWVPLDRVALLQTSGAAASTPAPVAGGQFAVGTRVAAKWKDGHYWYAAIGKIDADGYVINYADGDVWKVGLGDVVPIAPPGTLQVGDHVVAVWKGAKMYPGRITSLNGNTATVAWDDGDTPLAVPLDQIARP